MLHFLPFAILTNVLAILSGNPLNPSLHTYIESRVTEFDSISPARKEQLSQIATFVKSRLAAGQPARLTFICTHNSRRSHLAQILARTAAEYYDIQGVETFSGGTEATAFNPRAISALERAGFSISQAVESQNPHCLVRYRDSGPSLECFSKVYDQSPNPKTDFCAVMTCAQADAACPLVPGAALRVSLPYEDPKVFDGTSAEADRYDDRCRQIAREMLYVFSRVAN